MAWPLGEHNPEDYNVIPQAILKLHNPVAMRDTIRKELDLEVILLLFTTSTTLILTLFTPAIIVLLVVQQNCGSEYASSQIRKLLIRHFDISYQRHQIKWPLSAKRHTSV